MSDRRTMVLDAAIRVLGTEGLRHLTHRAVDATAGLPMGSTSNLFRTRQALITGVLGRLVEVETAAWQNLAAQSQPVGAEAGVAASVFVEILTRMVRELAGPGRVITVARHAIFHEAAFQPDLQRSIGIARQELAGWGIAWVAGLGSAQPREDYFTLLALVDGLLSNQLASPDPRFDPSTAIATAVRGILPAT